MVREEVKYTGQLGSKTPRNQEGLVLKIDESFLTISPKDGEESNDEKDQHEINFKRTKKVIS